MQSIHERPSQADLERADDEHYATDYATLEAIFRSQLERSAVPSLILRVGRLLADPSRALSDEQFLIDVFDRWGAAAVLRALARATEPTRLTPLIDVVEHE